MIPDYKVKYVINVKDLPSPAILKFDYHRNTDL